MTPGTVILGAGPAGLGAALALGEDALVLERATGVAGLSRSVILDGAVFDLGGHSFHTPHPAVRELVHDAVEMVEQRRDAWCWLAGEWIPYPFQKNAGALADAGQRNACLAGMAAAGGGGEARNFDEFLDQRFGRPAANLFMRPYNRKLWGDDLTRLTVDWTGERVAGPAGIAETFAGDGGRRTPLQSDTMVAYPAQGGFGEIFKALARRVRRLRLGTAVTAIDPVRRRLTTKDGEVIAWDRLISTLPLPALLAIIPDVPDLLLAGAAALEAVPVDLALVVLAGRGPVDRQRVYCPEKSIPGHKIVLNHTSSPFLRALPRHGIQVEIAASPVAARAADVIAGLLRVGLIKTAGEVRRCEILRLPLGYPVPTHARDKFIGAARGWLGARGISLAGRFAEWAYINADEALWRGLMLGGFR